MSLLTCDASDQKKRVRKNLKRRVRENYKRIKNRIRFEFANTTTNDIFLEFDPSEFDVHSYEYELAIFIARRKLESQGYKVELRKGQVGSYLFRSDRLFISW